MDPFYSEESAELVGLAFGDGSLTLRKGTSRLRFQLRGDATTDREHYDKFVIPLCNKLIGHVLGKNVCVVHDKKLNSFGVCVESSKLNDFFHNLGVPVGEKDELIIPNWILSSKIFSTAFARGLFDTDGGIHYRRNNTAKSRLPVVGMIYLSSTSKLLTEGTSKILSTLGLKHYVEFNKKHNGEKDFYKITVYRPHHRKFMAIIGSHNPKHLSKYAIGEKFGFCPSRTTPEQRTQILKGLLNPLSLITRESDSGQFS